MRTNPLETEMSRRFLLLCFLLAGAGALGAQTAEVLPAELRRIPATGVGEGHYWQQLAITLDQADEPGDTTVTVHLPPALNLLDTSGDGRVDDEVRVVYAGAGAETPEFFVSPELTTREQIVLGSRQPAAAGGRIYVQFPVEIIAILELPAVNYGPITFSDEREVDLEAGPELSYFFEEDFAALGSMRVVGLGSALAAGTDTSTGAVGTFYPDTSEVLVVSLPDLVFDNGVSTASALLGAGDGDDGNDVEYRFFFAADGALEVVDASTALEARIAAEELYIEHENGGRQAQLLTRDLAEGNYFLYVVSNVTGNIPLARSRGLQVRHAPRVEQVGPADGEVALDSGIRVDREGRVTGQGPHRAELDFEVVDNDDVPTVQLFYSPAADREAIHILLSEGAVSGLEGAAPIAAAIQQREGRASWDILEPEVVEAGAYYIYAVASDGRNFTLGRSQYQVRVQHSPFLRMDPVADRASGADTIATGGLRPQRYLTFTWGRSGSDGDQDLDDDAQLSLFYSTIPARSDDTEGFAIPDGAGALLADVGSNTQLIVAGLPEDPDQRGDNQYVWDLWGLAGGLVPQAGQVYYVYGLISDGVNQRLAQMNGGRLNDAGARLVFTHSPTLRPMQPLVETLVQPGLSGRVEWEDMDLDSEARLRVVLSLTNHGPVTDYATASAGAALVANSADGHPGPEVDLDFDLSEDSAMDYYDIAAERFPIPDGLYYLYLAAEGGIRFGPGSRAWRAPGQMRVQGGGAARSAFQLFPQVFSMGAGQRQAFELRVDAGPAAVDLVLATFKLDGAAFAPVDQDGALEGIQPFVAGERFSPAQLIGNLAAPQEDGSVLLSLAYFDPTGAVVGLDGVRALARVELLALEREGQAQIELIEDGGSGRVSRLERDGRPVLSPPGAVIAQGTVVAGRATIRGQLVLEGRQQAGTAVDFSLRPWSNYVPLEDSAFAAANDADPEQAGVQVLLQADESFELRQVPVGQLDLYARVSGYLDAWAPGLELLPGQLYEGVRPATPGADSLMLGGDVAGYTEPDGTSRPDNEVTLADWDFAARFFGLPVEPGNEASRADITGDGQVNIRDLALVGANFLGRGPRPVYKAAGMRPALRLSQAQTPIRVGQEVEFTVEGEGLEVIHALQFDVYLAPGQWEWSEFPLPGGTETLLAQRVRADGARVALSRQGRQGGLSAPLSRWRLRALQDDPVLPALGETLLLDGEHRPVAGQERAVQPREYALGQNYPNPFNPETTIEFALPAQERVRLEIFDALGQQVAVLWEGTLGAGPHRLRWDGRDQQGRRLGSGVYFYRLQGDSRVQVKRMVLLR